MDRVDAGRPFQPAHRSQENVRICHPRGGKHPDAKPLRGFGGAGVLEVVERLDGNTYRAMYTVKFEDVVYVLDAFQKKSKSGSKMAQVDVERIKSRLKLAEKHHEENYKRKSV